ncbi:MAG: hypothetical protein M1830_001754 [Pleopsidium flavum]|nr:MAG: hypothetical protein M1830_001754 [Pleopsidium flavum]
MSSDQKLQSSSAKVAEPVPSPFGDELDQSHGAPRRSSPTPGNTHRRRRSTKGTMPAIIKRSSSTPNVRGLASTDTAGMSLADKRRNKLGYHRTSVACDWHVDLSEDKINRRPCRALQKTKDTVFARAGRSPRTMLQLYPIEKGV